MFGSHHLAGDYERAVEASNSAEAITSVLYPNDNTTCESQLSQFTLHILFLTTPLPITPSASIFSRQGVAFEAAILLDGCQSVRYHQEVQESRQAIHRFA